MWIRRQSTVTVTTMFELGTYVIATKVVTLLAGGFVTFLAYRAFARTGSPALRALAAGLGLVTFGALIAGAVHQLTALDIVAGIAIQSTFTALGFVVLAYSLYVTTDADDDRGAPNRSRGPSGS